MINQSPKDSSGDKDEMSCMDLFTSQPTTFSGLQKDFTDAEYVVVGVPFDATSTYRPGSRFAPAAVREASLNIETYSFRAGIDLEKLKIHDAGDLHVTGDLEETLRRLELVASEILTQGKTPILIGGEHTVTLGAAKGMRGDSALLSFDAHLDLRDEYMGQSLCHATVVRRINEVVKPLKMVEVGTRAVCSEEIEYAKDHGIAYVTSHQIMRSGAEVAAKEINSILADCDQVYLTVDMDVLDPAFAPAVQTPEPEGLSTSMLLDILSQVCGRRTVALDVVEVTPHYDGGITAIQAAKIIFETLCYIHKEKKASSNSR